MDKKAAAAVKKSTPRSDGESWRSILEPPCGGKVPGRRCIMGEKCDCVYNTFGCKRPAGAGILEVIEEMACLTVCWSYRQRLHQ